jgi:capsular exopolysaccharide synthesis family protein
VSTSNGSTPLDRRGSSHVSAPAEHPLHNFTRVLRRRWMVILLALIVVPAATMALTLSKEKEYTATSVLLIRSDGTELLFRDTPVLPSSPDEEREAATQADLASLTPVAAETARRLGPGVTAGTVGSSVKVNVSPSSNIVRVEAINTDPELARRMANTYAQEFIDFRAEGRRAKLDAIRNTLEGQVQRVNRRITRLERTGTAGPGGERRAELRQLRDEREQILQRQGELSATSAVQAGNLELVERAQTPGSPSSPKPMRNLVVGIGLGLVLGLGLAALFEILDRRLKEPREIEEIFKRPIVGAVPESRDVAQAGAQASELTPGDREAFRMLRTSLHYFNVTQPVHSVLVTSPAPEDGKTTIAWNLAAAAASSGTKTLLLEAELRKPSFVRQFNLPMEAGLTDFLAYGLDVEDVTYQLPLGEGRHGTEAAAVLSVIPAGATPPNPTDLIESDRMAWLIKAVESRYDFVVIDAPPATVVSDALPLINQVSGVLVVTRLGKTTRDGAQHLQDRLQNMGAPVLGVVINSIGSADGVYGQAYGYASVYGPGRRAKQPV